MISFVYVIGPEDMYAGALVKIGVTTSIRDRLQTFQCGSPIRLAVLWAMPGNRDLEAWLHGVFADQRQYGEWFDLGPEPVKVVQEKLGPYLINVLPAEMREFPIRSHTDDLTESEPDESDQGTGSSGSSMRAVARDLLREDETLTNDDLRNELLVVFGQDSNPNSIWRSIDRARKDLGIPA